MILLPQFMQKFLYDVRRIVLPPGDRASHTHGQQIVGPFRTARNRGSTHSGLFRTARLSMSASPRANVCHSWTSSASVWASRGSGPAHHNIQASSAQSAPPLYRNTVCPTSLVRSQERRRQSPMRRWHRFGQTKKTVFPVCVRADRRCATVRPACGWATGGRRSRVVGSDGGGEGPAPAITRPSDTAYPSD